MDYSNSKFWETLHFDTTMAKLMFENTLSDTFSRRLTVKNQGDTNSEDAYEFRALCAVQELF